MLRILSFFSFISASLAQFKPPPALTFSPVPSFNIFTISTNAPVRTIRSTIQNITSTLSTATLSFTSSTSPTSTSPTSTTQTNDPENTEEINTNLFFILIPATLLLLFFVYLCIRKKKRNINVVNIDLNIENNIPLHEPVNESLQEPVNESFQEPVNESFQEPIRQSSNLSNHFYEEIDYESRYEMPTIQNVKYENTIQENVKYENTIQESAIQENEYGKQVATTV
jgi:hypothetical protein